MGEEILTGQQIRFWIPGRVTPKARPRVTRNGVYFPRSYQRWRKMAECEMILQVPSSYKVPIKQAAVHVRLVGQMRGDADNHLGAVLDGMKSAGIIVDDRLSCIPEISLKAVPGKPVGVEIIVIPLV